MRVPWERPASRNVPHPAHAFGRRGGILAGAVILNLVVLPVALFQARAAIERGATSRDDAASAHAFLGHGQDVLVQLLEAENGHRGYLLTGDPTYLEAYALATATMAEWTDRLRGATGTAVQEAGAARITGLVQAKLAELARTIEAYDSGGDVAVTRELDEAEDRALMEEIRAELGDLLAEADEQAQLSAVAADAEQRLARTIALLTTLFVVGNLIAMLTLLRQRGRWEHQREQLLQELADLAVLDPLTGVLNRRTLEERVRDAVSRALAGETEVAVHYIDLDGFKPVNDLFGHDTGDLVLTTVARQLQASLRDGDAVSRVGGDEFVVVMETFPEGPGAEALMRRLEAATTIALDAPGSRGGDDQELVVVTASIGRATLRQDLQFTEGSRDPTLLARRLLAAADADMYSRKTSRRPVAPTLAPAGLTLAEPA